MMKLYFYTTLGCHLCEEALLLLRNAGLTHQFELVSVEISDDEKLMELYGIRIPVILNKDNEQELCWPFDRERLERFFTL